MVSAAPHKLRLTIAMIDMAGGTGTFCRNLATGLNRYHAGEFDLSLLVLRDRGLLESDRGLFQQVRIAHSPVHVDRRRFVETFGHAVHVRRLVAELQPEAIFTVGTYANLLLSLVVHDRPVILSEHAHPTRRLADVRFPRIMGTLMRWLYPDHLVVGPAQGVVEDLKARFGVRRGRCIYHGADVQKVRELAEAPAEDLPADRPFAIACGRLILEKDYPTMLNAFSQARRDSIVEDLVILGDGEERANLQALADRLGLAASVHFLGHRPNPFPYMKRARYLVLSSIWEGFGYVLLEAMAVGVPCIATDCPSGPAEILGHGEFGLVVPPRDVQQLAAAMVRLSRLEEVRSLLSAQALRRAGQLSLKRMAGEYRDAFLDECGVPRRLRWTVGEAG